MLGDPATAAHPDRSHLAVVKPDTRHALHPLALKTEECQHVDYHLLELAQIPMQIALSPAQVQHGIGHQLARHVMGHFTAAIDAMQRRRWRGWIKQQMLLRSAAAEGVTARVLQDPNRLWSRLQIGCQLGCQQRRLPLLLPAPGLGEGHQLLRLKKNCRVVLGALV